MSKKAIIQDRGANGKLGAKWITRHKRLAIYLRDGLACCYCKDTLEEGAKLTLDHLNCNHDKGNHHAENLVTCCHRCNSSRGNRPVATFCRSVAEYLNHGIEADTILKHVRNCSRRKLDTQAAKKIIEARGGWSPTLEFYQK